MERKDLAMGDRVQLHPGTDAWMRGDRYGRIVCTGSKYAHVIMDSGRHLKIRLDNILEVIEAQRRVWTAEEGRG